MKRGPCHEEEIVISDECSGGFGSVKCEVLR